MRGPTLTRLWVPVGAILFGVWLFGWLPARPPDWLTEAAPADSGMGRTLYLLMLTFASIGPFIWIDTSRIRRRFFLRDIPAMLRLVLSSRRGAFILTVVAMHFVGMGAYLAQGEPPDSYFLRIMLVTVAMVLMSILLPPVAIVLASSSPPSGELLRTVAKHLAPLRVVSLLDGKYLGPRNWTSKEDNLRTILGNSWRSAVHRLIEITPLVIIDTRVVTDAVCEEIRHMLNEERVGKAIFIVERDGSSPGVRACDVDTTEVVLISCTLEDVPRTIAAFQRSTIVSSGSEIDSLILALGVQDGYEPAVTALAAKGPAAVESLVRVLGNKREPWLRRKNAAVTLGLMQCEFDISCLVDALGDSNRNVQQGAAWALGKLRIAQAVPPLAELLGDPQRSWYTKACAVDALREIGTPEARSALSSFSGRLGQHLQSLRRAEMNPELRLLRNFVAERHAALGGAALDFDDVIGEMARALDQLRERCE